MWSYGIDTSGVKFDWGVLKKNRDAYILRLNHIYTDMLQSNKVELIKGFGKFIDNYNVECQGNRYTADHILIATGSRPCTPNLGRRLHRCRDGTNIAWLWFQGCTFSSWKTFEFFR